MQRFVLLEFTNPRVRRFLADLRSALDGEERTSCAHITVRGPYVDVPEPALLRKLEENLSGRGVVIGGAGAFAIKQGFAVYLRAQSPVFSEIWWKPDYPEGEFGINPHITIFETADQTWAKAVETFLRAERIEIFTFGVHVTVRASKQHALFELNVDPELQKRRTEWERWRIRPGILSRARRLRSSFLNG